jgi:hypothetical protein
MGSGKGYLTFALYDHLTATPVRTISVTGVEAREDLVLFCNKTAQKAGFDGLRFVRGTIDSYDAAGADLLIALHACDTATDDAIYKGIRADAKLIIVAPCCHKQIRREMEKGAADSSLEPMLRHGIFLERQAEMATDTLRALLLERHGYAVKAFEFISDSHTPKNVMIVAERKKGAAKDIDAVTRRIESFKQLLGIRFHYLETLLAGKGA